MTDTGSTRPDLSPTQADNLVRSLPISPLQARQIEDAMSQLPGEWSVDLMTAKGESYAVLVPGEGDSYAPSFVIERTFSSWILTPHHWDVFEAVTVFSDLPAALGAVASAARDAAGAARARVACPSAPSASGSPAPPPAASAFSWPRTRPPASARSAFFAKPGCRGTLGRCWCGV